MESGSTAATGASKGGESDADIGDDPRVAMMLCYVNGDAAVPEKVADKLPSFPYDVVRTHELKPHRRTVPMDGVQQGFNQLRLTLVISPSGDVTKAKAEGDATSFEFWPSLEGEVEGWRFTPFEKDGHAVVAEVEEYIDLVPPERLARKHVKAPMVRPGSEVRISLLRTGCYGSCPAYHLLTSTKGIEFEGHGFVVAAGKHTGSIDPDEVRALARRFVEADFFSMGAIYRAGVTDSPTYDLTIEIDDKSKSVEDYVGSWVGMPSVITDLEEETDALAESKRWIEGSDGLVQALQAEHFNFKTYEAQSVLKEAACRGNTATVEDLLEEGVPLKTIAAPKSKSPDVGPSMERVGWLTAASSHSDALIALIHAGASKQDQKDKDLALVGAARSGDVDGARALIAYGADPNADLAKLTMNQKSVLPGPGSGSVLIYAAESGDPEMIREILKYHPDLEARGDKGKTAIFAAGDSRSDDQDGARVECVRLLAKAGANVNARDEDGNTLLSRDISHGC